MKEEKIVKALIVAIAVISIFAFAISASAAQPTVTRSIEPGTVDAGDVVDVTISFTATEDLIGIPVLKDVVPEDWEVTDLGSTPLAAMSFDPDISTVSFIWTTISKDTPVTASYKLRVPGDADNDSYPLSGALYNFGEVYATVGGDNTVTVGVQLTAYANGPYLGSVDKEIQFYGSATGGTPSYTYHWDFGDGSTSTLQNPTHIYTTATTYTATLTVTDSEGAIDDNTASVTVSPEPLTADAHGPYTGIVDEEIQFEGSASGGTPDYSWLWDFGDGSTSDVQNPTHIYTTANTYTATLTVTDSEEATDEGTASVTVSSKPPLTATRNISKQIVNPGEIFNVTVVVNAIEDVFAPILNETYLPAGWTVTEIESAGATYKASEVKWLWTGMWTAGTSKTVTYNVTVPSDAAEGEYELTGVISAYGIGPTPVKGESKVKVSEKGSVSGKITYTYGEKAGIEGVTVNLTKDGAVVDTKTTTGAGDYVFTEIEPGDYCINASKPKIVNVTGFWDNSTEVSVSAETVTVDTIMLWLKGDLNNDGESADAVDVTMMMQASVGDIPPLPEGTAPWEYYNLDGKDGVADAVDVTMMIQASVGDIVLEDC